MYKKIGLVQKYRSFDAHFILNKQINNKQIKRLTVNDTFWQRFGSISF